MALTPEDHAVRPLTADQVDRMVESGILGAKERVELLDGMLVEMSPKGEEHMRVMSRLFRWLAPLAIVEALEVRTEGPLRVPDPTSMPEPDIAVVELREDLTQRPTTALLAIEVSVTSLRIDTQIKPRLYAQAGVPDYWVIDVPGRRIEVRREPGADGYRTLDVIEPGGHADALVLDLPPLALNALLAGL